MGFSLVLSLAGGIISLAFAIMIRNEDIVIVFSSYLHKSIVDIVFITGVTVGCLVTLLNFIGALFLTSVQRQWMFYVYSPMKMLCFTCLFGLGIYIEQCGKTGAGLINDYCDSPFQRW